MAELDTEAPVADAEVVDPPARPVLHIRDVHVTYRAREDRLGGLRQFVASGFRRPKRREINAVRGIDLTVFEGEAVGVVGRNGSGKSTLLKAITGLIPPSHGEIRARSQPTLMGVGAALRPNLSGRANVEIGCLASGMARSEVARRFDEIVGFAGLEDFIDLPMKSYSSGMRARLHFSIATANPPDILLIDEALTVGDEEFRQRAHARLSEIRASAGCVLLVSHRLSEIVQSCNRAIWIDRGVVREQGPARAVVHGYKQEIRGLNR